MTAVVVVTVIICLIMIAYERGRYVERETHHANNKAIYDFIKNINKDDQK